MNFAENGRGDREARARVREGELHVPAPMRDDCNVVVHTTALDALVHDDGTDGPRVDEAHRPRAVVELGGKLEADATHGEDGLCRLSGVKARCS